MSKRRPDATDERIIRLLVRNARLSWRDVGDEVRDEVPSPPNPVEPRPCGRRSGSPDECNPSRKVVGADRKDYRLDTYIIQTAPAGGRAAGSRHPPPPCPPRARG